MPDPARVIGAVGAIVHAPRSPWIAYETVPLRSSVPVAAFGRPVIVPVAFA